MRADILLLAFGYVLSQYFRSFLSVLTPELSADLGATPGDFANALGWWFISFAFMQFPVGWALDRIGPRRTASFLFLIAALGVAIFARATEANSMIFGMALIGIGCSPILMASYFIFAREFPAQVFATMAGFLVGFGMLGNLLASMPTDWAIGAFGWRTMLWSLAALSAFIAVLLLVLVRDPAKLDHDDKKGSLADIFKIWPLWAIFPILFFHYAPSAGLRGIWIGPYLTEIFDAADWLGWASLAMGGGMVLGSIAYGPLDRIFKTRKWIVICGSLIMINAIFLLALFPAKALWGSVSLIVVIGVAGATYPVLFAHARAFLPPHLTGRGMTMLNLCSIGGVGSMQFLSSKAYQTTLAASPSLTTAYSTVFLLFGGGALLGLLIYLRSEDRLD